MAQRVLLIEDEPNIAEALAFILTREGWEVIHLADGARAAPAAHEMAARGQAADLVILDHMLPGASGLEILAALRADPLCHAVPVLMLTAKGLPRDREAAERAGVSRFMTKPFAIADILAEVRALTAPAAADQGQGAA